MSDTLTGKTIGKYDIVERLGKGGMAEVYKGYQKNLDRYVAVKVMHAFLITEEDFLNRFRREAQAMAKLSHPNIVGVYDFDVYGENSYYLVMEFIGGGTLKEKLDAMAASNEKMTMEQTIRICTEVANALAYAHRRNMVHRDIKPGNIMLDETGKAILTDFGIVKLVGNQSMAYTATGALIGTPSYMSPEQALGKPGDERVDIYALGVLLFQMVANKLPFVADTPLAVVMKHVNEQPPLPVEFNPDVPLALQEIILKALAKNPDDRYASAKEMADALQAINLDGPKATAGYIPTTTPSSPTISATSAEDTAPGKTAVSDSVDTAPGTAAAAPPRKRSPWLYIGIVVLALLLLGGGLAAAGVFNGDPTPTPVAQVVNPPATEAPPQDTPEPSETVPPTETPISQQDIVRTVLAEDALTQEAAFTSTPTKTATPTKTPTSTPTVDTTRAFLQTCTTNAELVNVVRAGFSSNFVPVNSPFKISWTLRNSGTCPLPANLVWNYVDGDELGNYEEPVVSEDPIPAGEEVQFETQLGPVSNEGTYESTWQLFNGDNEPLGPEFTFEVIAFEPATATPIPPTPTFTPEAPVVAEGQVDWIFTVQSCDYPGNGPDWRCRVIITPYIDGSDAIGEYTVFVFDQSPPQEFRGPGPHTVFVGARRCAAYNQEVRVIDDLTVTEKSKPLYIDPDLYFEGGCTK